ncbi:MULTISPECIES: YHS domain-containing (seleno)protein [unclassified Roseovarius]|uniref:YHS domain-containing (seleno)protein n=1 Tax=unclassified Roseovarius TaxID=2614913 RepID=UPI00273F8946|nr:MULTISPECIES: YHS domain-containing (seleno)protein [unclassified Roseovarius]
MKTSWIILVLVVHFMLCPVPARAEPEVNLGYFNELAMNGYDVMTYWKGGDPQKGDPAIAATYKGATWVFTTVENRGLFLADPARYAPQYGGYCAYAASQNAIADVDPFAWRIWEGKLYLNYSPRVRRQWASNIDANIQKADGYWPVLLNKQ